VFMLIETAEFNTPNNYGHVRNYLCSGVLLPTKSARHSSHIWLILVGY